MDWAVATERHREALKRILVMLLAMAEMGAGGQFVLFPQNDVAASSPARAEKGKRSPALILPRYLHRAILKLLHPTEAAARRLIILAARGLAVTLPPLRPRQPKPARQIRKPGRLGGPVQSDAPRVPSLPLFDPLRKSRPWSGWTRRMAGSGTPRICLLGAGTAFQPLPSLPSRDDPVDAARLALRLEALGLALDDLPGQARRFARWRARRDAARDRTAETAGAQTQGPDARSEHEKMLDAIGARRRARKTAAQKGSGPKPVRARRLWPLKPGRPPGWRKKPVHEVHEILNDVHGLALWALEAADTS